MKRRIGIKRRLMAQRLINKRRSVRKDIESAKRDSVALVDVTCLASTRLPHMLSDSLAA